MKCVDALKPEELKEKRVFLRTSLNLPIAADGSVGDLFRLKRGMPTIEFLVKNGARVIIVGYLGRKGDSMRPVAEALMKYAPNIKMYFFGTDFEQAPMQSNALKDGECLILESTRRNAGEEANNTDFVKLLASCADIFVDDAFAEAHRDYASNAGVAKLLPSYAGLLLRDEIKALDAARKPISPSLAILGGAKFETKAPLIKLLLEKYDHVFVTGALSNDVFKARGFQVGRSLISQELPDASVLQHPHFLAPVDVTVEAVDGQVYVKKPDALEATDNMVDIGPDSVAMLAPLIAGAKSFLWSGPTGIYERGFTIYTEHIAELVGKSTASKVIGGGDTIAAIEKCGAPEDQLGFLSTGGGAMLEYLLKGTLPAIEALS